MSNFNDKMFSLGKLDIVDLYEWKRSGKLVYNNYFQRQSVWQMQDRKELIDTIMMGLPIPAIFICDSKTEISSLTKTYNVLDGRQRLESIFMYLNNEFSYKDKYFNELEIENQKKILNYNITLIQMYVDSNDTDKIKEIFKRLNKNSYNLNPIEKTATQFVEYDFMIIGKIATGYIQLDKIENYVEEINNLFPEEEQDNELRIYESKDDSFNIEKSVKDICISENINNIRDLFDSEIIFTSNEKHRQLSLQHFLNIFATILEESNISRNVKENQIKKFSNMNKEKVCEKLTLYNKACEIIKEIYSDVPKFWLGKSSFFTLSIVIVNAIKENKKVSTPDLINRLTKFMDRDDFYEYNSLCSQGVNEKNVRDERERIICKVLFE